MRPMVFEGATRGVGLSQGYVGLPIRYSQIVDGDETLPTMDTMWLPSNDELDKLNRGAPVQVCVLGKVHPPIKLSVPDPIEVGFPTLQAFKDWLGSMAPDRLISFDWDVLTHPLTMFLRSFGHSRPAILGIDGEWTPDGDLRTLQSLPPWAREFCYWVRLVTDAKVTAEDCLFIIEQPMFDPSKWEDGRERRMIGTTCLG